VSELEPWRNPRTAPYQSEIAKTVVESSLRAWLRAWWPALVWAVVIFMMSTDTFSSEHTAWVLEPVIRWIKPSLTTLQVEMIHHYIRKAAHFTEYFIFCLLLFRAVRGQHRGWRWMWGLTALFIAAAYSALDEVHQAFVASRTASPYDSLLDTTGAFAAMTVLWLWFRAPGAGRNTPSETGAIDYQVSPPPVKD
jgi:VanZ family protein